MKNFEDAYFWKYRFTEKQIRKFFSAAARDLAIARPSDVPEVIFKFSYDALIKFGLALIAKEGYRVRSAPGHHAKIIEKISEILDNEEVLAIGDAMRQARNRDLYEGDSLISEKGSKEYFHFVAGLIRNYVGKK